MQETGLSRLERHRAAAARGARRHGRGAVAATGNPSSVHAEGRAARRLVEEAREKVAALVGAEPRNVVFTSGGTEANVLALSPLTGAGPGPRSRSACRPAGVRHRAPFGAGGRTLFSGRGNAGAGDSGRASSISQALERLLSAKMSASTGSPLVSLMLANNETGVVQPVSQVARMVHEAGGLLHVDAVQAPGRIAVQHQRSGR